MTKLFNLVFLVGLLFTFPVAVEAQPHPFVVFQSKSMSSDTVAITLKQAGDGRRIIYPAAAVLECPSATTLSIEIDSTSPATTTAVTPTSKSPTRRASGASAFINSNATGGTVIATITAPAATAVMIDLTDEVYLPAKTGDFDLTLRSGTVTSGTCRAWLSWVEP